MTRNTFLIGAVLICGGLVAVAAVGCSDDTPLSPDQQALAALRQTVAPFRDLHAAQQAGYQTVVTDPTNGKSCLSDPTMGAMGVHYLNTDNVDDAVVPTKPEVTIYEPQQDGSFKFVGVEFIIPYSIRGENETPPVLFGQQFQHNPTFQLWMLHVWVGRDNPAGLFATWNPDVTCQFGAN